jgi:adenylosuccinate synthase
MSGWIVVDLGFGDAGKGATVDALVRHTGARLVVRFNGGAQAGHNVVTSDGRHHTFSQFCSGSFVAGAVGLLGPDFVLHPLGMVVEAEHLESIGIGDAFARTWVSDRARVITPYQQVANRVRERLRGQAAHGSCGVGVGECVSDALTHPDEGIVAGMLDDQAELRRRLQRQRERKRAELVALGANGADLELFDDVALVDRVIAIWGHVVSRLSRLDDDALTCMIRNAPNVVFEGAQGVLLDERYGFHPHTTWSRCTAEGALELAGDRPLTRLGVVRAYATRHGAGPFPTEDASMNLPELHNPDGHAGRFRIGALDVVLLRYALRVAAMDGLAVTCLDRVGPTPLVCLAYDGFDELALPGTLDEAEALGRALRSMRPVLSPCTQLSEAVEQWTGVKVMLTSFGPTAGARQWCV